MKLIICAPSQCDYAFVRKTLNKLTFELTDVILVTDGSPDTYRLAERWLLEKWKNNAIRGYDQKRYSLTIKHHYDGKEKQQRLDMIQDADALIAFWDVGNVDEQTEALYNLAKLYGLKTKRILV